MAKLMTVGDLIELLSEYDPDLEVRLIEQPSWPFEYSIAGVVSSDEIAEHDKEPQEDRHPSTGITPKPTTVFIVEGRQLSYGSKTAWDLT
jgi:hypothetical protein